VAMIAIGVHVHAQSLRLLETLAALHAHTAPGFELLLLPDGPDPQTRAALAHLTDIKQSPTDAALGPAACFNRLAGPTTAETLVLLESGTLVSPGWLEILCEAFAADPRHGLACPSTNRAWNQLAAFPCGAASDIARTAAEAAVRFGRSWRSLAPLWDVADFCLAAKREAVAAAGPADEGYGLGPCWEMDYAVRVVRAGFLAVWAPGAYVFRHPFTPRRQREEARLFDASRRRYQDTLRAGDPAQSAPLPAPAIVSDDPLVSCIMPTSGRRGFVPHAIRLFLEQDYRRKELIVVDDGEDAVVDLMPPDPEIRYVRESVRRRVGGKRNVACEIARGEVVAHWDDDDWYAPWRLSYQVAALDGVQLCGLDRMLFIDEPAGRAWEYVYPQGGSPWVHGATLCYRHQLWQRTRFTDVSIGEDTLFVSAAPGNEVRILERREFYVGRIHPGNVSPKQMRDPRWHPVPYAEVRALIV
jgi:O-antigen biosynthesis protein